MHDRQDSNPGTPFSATGTMNPLMVSFDALSDNNTSIPPDTYGSVGPLHVMTMLNTQVRVQDKTGNIDSTVSLSTFWSDSDPFDPRVNFDVLSGRWIATCGHFTDSIHTAINLAVSASSDPLGLWFFYQFTGAAVSDSQQVDFPTVGFNSQWIAIGANMFKPDGRFVGSKMWVVQKSSVLSGGTAAMTVFPTGFDLAGGVDGFSLLPCIYCNPSDTLFIVDNSDVFQRADTTFLLRLSRITGAPSSPAWSAAPNSAFNSTGLFPVANNFNEIQIDAVQSGTPIGLDGGDNRMLNAIYRNGQIWCAHSGGLPAKIKPTPNRTAAFWYQINPASMPSPIVQSGVIDGGQGVHLIYPSIAANAANDAVIGFTRTDAFRFPEAAFTGRRSSDPAGGVQAVQVIQAGQSFYQKFFGGDRNRWGDYSNTCVDPANGMTFWTIQEYAGARVGSDSNSGRWVTRWARIEPSDVVQGVAPTSGLLPERTTLQQNYPNPFNGSSNIGFRIAEFGVVKLAVYDVLGREVAVLVEEMKEPGSYEVKFDGSGLSSGIYFCRLTTPHYAESRRMLLLK